MDVEGLVRDTDGFSGAEIVLVAREAALMAIDRDVHVERVEKEDF
jgi:SpoVK/Ycf46/Vps4 family AAA+-type ATPase